MAMNPAQTLALNMRRLRALRTLLHDPQTSPKSRSLLRQVIEKQTLTVIGQSRHLRNSQSRP